MNSTRYIIQDREQSSLAEAYRVLRGNLQKFQQEQQAKTILFVSAVKGDGNAMAAINTAATLAYAGKKVILLDGDLRTPYLGSILGARQLGLTDLVGGEKAVEDVLQPTPIANVSLLGSGRLPEKPVDILSHSRIKGVLEELRGRADYVLIACSPLVVVANKVVSDACIWASKVDGVVMALAARAVRVKTARKVTALLQGANAHILGVVLQEVRDDSYLL